MMSPLLRNRDIWMSPPFRRPYGPENLRPPGGLPSAAVHPRSSPQHIRFRRRDPARPRPQPTAPAAGARGPRPPNGTGGRAQPVPPEAGASDAREAMACRYTPEPRRRSSPGEDGACLPVPLAGSLRGRVGGGPGQRGTRRNPHAAWPVRRRIRGRAGPSAAGSPAPPADPACRRVAPAHSPGQPRCHGSSPPVLGGGRPVSAAAAIECARAGRVLGPKQSGNKPWYRIG